MGGKKKGPAKTVCVKAKQRLCGNRSFPPSGETLTLLQAGLHKRKPRKDSTGQKPETAEKLQPNPTQGSCQKANAIKDSAETLNLRNPGNLTPAKP